MDTEEARSLLGDKVIWEPVLGHPVLVYVMRILTKATLYGYYGPDRILIRFPNMASEIDVDPRQLRPMEAIA